MTISEAISRVEPGAEGAKAQARHRFAQLAIPLGSLGRLQDLVVQLCGISGDISPSIQKRGVVVFCADHGVVAQGISQVDSHVTSAVAEKLVQGNTVMCTMAKCSNCDVIPVDIGMKHPIYSNNIIKSSIALGTKDFSLGPAMTEKEGETSIEIGINLALDLHRKGYQLLVTGEMGIGNTTAAAAMASVLLNLPPLVVTGPGAGLSAEGVAHKVKIIEKSIKKNDPDPKNPVELLSKLGGFELGGMVGLMLGCAVAKIPCVVDGFLSNLSALVAISLCPAVQDYLLFSHGSPEPGSKVILEKLGEKPILQGDFRLGEGSGGVALLPLFDMGVAIFSEGITFSDMNISAYQPL